MDRDALFFPRIMSEWMEPSPPFHLNNCSARNCDTLFASIKRRSTNAFSALVRRLGICVC